MVTATSIADSRASGSASVDVTSLPAIELQVLPVRVAAGDEHTLAVSRDGHVYAWGHNGGRLGDGATSARQVPTLITGFPPDTRIASVAAGGTHSLALSTDGELFAWGINSYGQLGNGSTEDRLSPELVTTFPPGTRVARIAAGRQHSLAVTSGGEVYAWGQNQYGQLGDGTQTARTTPTLIEGFPSGVFVGQVAAGAHHSVALSTDGNHLFAWGVGMTVGDGTSFTRTRPTSIDGLPGISRIAAGDYHTLAVSANSIYAWGLNYVGQVGGGGEAVLSPVRVIGEIPAATAMWSVAGGEHHSLLSAYNRDLDEFLFFGWGDSWSFQLGDGLQQVTPNPTRNPYLPSNIGIRALDGGKYQSVALVQARPGDDATVMAWGGIGAGVGSPNYVERPTIVLSDEATIGTLTLDVRDGGRVFSSDGQVECTSSSTACVAHYEFAGAGSEVPIVTLTAVPEPGKTVQWFEACDWTFEETCTLNMVADRKVTVGFRDTTRRSTLDVEVIGSGVVTSDDGRIDCRNTGGVCSTSYTFTAGNAPQVNLSATPDAGNSFTRWLGTCTGSVSICALDMGSSHSITASFVDERDFELSVCEVWSVSRSGGAGTTLDTWDISMIPTGATFDMRFNAYSLPDRFSIEYPDGNTVHDTGWRGNQAYEGDPNYPGGIAGPGQGEVLNLFDRGPQTQFRIAVVGPDPGTAWDYQIRCRE